MSLFFFEIISFDIYVVILLRRARSRPLRGRSADNCRSTTSECRVESRDPSFYCRSFLDGACARTGMAGGKIFCHTIIQNELNCFNSYTQKFGQWAWLFRTCGFMLRECLLFYLLAWRLCELSYLVVLERVSGDSQACLMWNHKRCE